MKALAIRDKSLTCLVSKKTMKVNSTQMWLIGRKFADPIFLARVFSVVCGFRTDVSQRARSEVVLAQDTNTLPFGQHRPPRALQLPF